MNSAAEMEIILFILMCNERTQMDDQIQMSEPKLQSTDHTLASIGRAAAAAIEKQMRADGRISSTVGLGGVPAFSA